MVNKFERMNADHRGQKFWAGALGVMGIDLTTPQSQIDNIPQEGPVVVVANHPHGMVDGMVLAELIGRRREDYRILTRSVLTGLDEAATSFMIPFCSRMTLMRSARWLRCVPKPWRTSKKAALWRCFHLGW